MEKEICKEIFERSKDVGLQYTCLLGDCKDYKEVKATYGVCEDCKKYDEMTKEEKQAFDKSKDGMKLWQKHREEKVDCKRVNKIEFVNHVDRRRGTPLRDLRDSLKGKKMRDGEPIGGRKHRLTD